MITGLHHVNIIIPPSPSSLELANCFYGQTLGLTPRPVPAAQEGRLAWFDIGSSGQQVHVAFGREHVDFTESAKKATRHPCFRVESVQKLRELQEKVWIHFSKGRLLGQEGERAEGRIQRESAPMECDEPGKLDSGAQGPEYPTRFFARDFAGNRLEFTV
ncbi:hypothetical protein QBC37DRAFT_433012 [Rhypophila decipiens]|uniref:Glyoxalase family protein n=1 Tax=Rhypophila decipiens TaxID=261697 RepID=A0AAN6XVM0_9PEZI|nr:hypothetical protein QBC37DRAFT_433012 [Rhypophila decipiens]